MSRYLEVFFARKVPLVALVAIALVVSMLVVMIMPRSYRASASLWFDHSPIPDNSGVSAQLTLADQSTALFHELINTRDFDVKVGRRGPLAAYFDTTGNFPTSDPVTPMLHKLEGKPAPSGAVRSALVDNGVVLTLQKYLLIEPSEPQAVSLTFDFSDPTVVAGTLKAVIDQFTDQVKASASISYQGSVNFYEGQLNAQLKVVQDADAAVARYLAAHPDLQRPNAPFDPSYASLQQEDDLARRNYADLSQKLADAKLTLASLQQPGPYGFRIVDQPQAPLSASGMLKSVVVGAAGGLGVGLLLVFVICFVLVSTDNSFVRSSDLKRRLDVQVIGEIPLLSADLPRARATPKALPRKLV